MTTKKKQKKNEDFKKVKLKVGKKLKKTATTDATITAKKIIITSQLSEKVNGDDNPLSFRGLSLDELCNQLGHFNKNIRKEALIGTKQLLSSRPDLIVIHLRTLIPSVGRLLNESASDPSLNSHLKALFTIICTVEETSISAHFTLLMAHTLHALTNMEVRTRALAFSILSILMSKYPRLCKGSSELFTTFVKFLSSSRKPVWNSPKFLNNILIFLSIYESAKTSGSVQPLEASLSIENAFLSRHINLLDCNIKTEGPFDFAVLSKNSFVCASPFELPDNLIVLSESLTPVVTTALLEDHGGAFLNVTLAIVEAAGRIANKQANSFLITDFKKKLNDIWLPVKKAAFSRKSDRIRQAVNWMSI